MDDFECINAYLKEGNLQAMDILVEKHKNALLAFAKGMAGTDADANEIFQETWFRALRSIRNYRSNNFRGWLMRIARNIFIDRIRKRKSEVSIDSLIRDNAAFCDFLPSQTLSPDQEFSETETSMRIHSALGKLPSEQREVFILRVFADLPFKEIAAIQKVSINTALARMQYAVKKLREELRADYLGLDRNDGDKKDEMRRR